MRAFILLSVFLAIAVLLVGCAQSNSSVTDNSSTISTPSAPAVIPTIPASDNNAPPAAPVGTNNTAGANNPTTSPPTPSPVGTCTLTLDKQQITAGQSAVLTMRANPGPGVNATYLCGSDTQSMGTNGLFNTWKVCTFNTVGNVTVFMALNGQPCATANLEVIAAGSTNPLASCFIVPGSRNYSLQDGLRTYTATVSYANYSSGATLSWDCAWKSYQKSLVSGGFNTQSNSGSVIVNCQYTFDPGTLTTLPVHINNDLCGDILQ